MTIRKFRKFSQICCQKIHKSYNFAFTTISCHHILEYSISFPIKKTETNSNGNFLRSFHFNTEKMKKKVFDKINVKVFPFEIMQNLCTQCMKWSILVLFVMWVACLQKNKSLCHFFLLQNCCYSKICIGLSRPFWPHPWGILVNILSSNRGFFYQGWATSLFSKMLTSQDKGSF